MSKVNRTFNRFLQYTQKFPSFGFADGHTGEDLKEIVKNRKTRLQKMRSELGELPEFSEVETVQFMNLCPNNVEEAVSWIPSLERLISAGKELEIKRAIEVVQKNSPIESNY